ncbi:MAG: MarR family transcriptional regulator [Anderseniella sp.]
MDDRPVKIIDTSQNGQMPVSFWLKRAAQYSADLYAEQLGKSGLTQRQYTVLETLRRNEGRSQTVLVRQSGIDRSTLADLINRLEMQGYLRRERSENDARVNYVFLTESGREMLAKAEPMVSLVDKALVDSLPEGKREAFQTCLHLLSSRLDVENADS